MKNLSLRGIKLGLRDLLDKRRTDLESCEAGRYYLPMLTETLAAIEALPEGKTLNDVATGFLAAGEKLHLLLSDRADAPTAARKDAGRLRGEALGLVNRLRGDVKRELIRKPALPRDFDQRLFGYFDQLEAMQKSPAKAGGSVPTVPSA